MFVKIIILFLVSFCIYSFSDKVKIEYYTEDEIKIKKQSIIDEIERNRCNSLLNDKLKITNNKYELIVYSSLYGCEEDNLLKFSKEEKIKIVAFQRRTSFKDVYIMSDTELKKEISNAEYFSNKYIKLFGISASKTSLTYNESGTRKRDENDKMITFNNKVVDSFTMRYSSNLYGISIGGMGSMTDILITPKGRLLGVFLGKMKIPQSEANIGNLTKLRNMAMIISNKINEIKKDKGLNTDHFVWYAYIAENDYFVLKFRIHYKTDNKSPIKIIEIPYSDFNNFEKYLDFI